MRPLIINAEIRKVLQGIVIYAESNPFTMDDMLDMFNLEIPDVSNRQGYSCVIPDGYHITYSIEEQAKGRVRHLSVYVPADNKLPNVTAVEAIMREMSFKSKSVSEGVDVEMDKVSETKTIVNVFEYI